MKTSLSFDNVRWRWLIIYQELILHEKPFSLFVTFLGSIVYLIIMIAITLFFTEDHKTVNTLVIWYLWSIPAFYVANWLVALHGVYRKEQKRMWQELKS
jgi:hypothetical protein